MNESANNPALSIIIPCYNAEKYLTETLDSVIAQPCDDYEIILIDDGSTDNTLSVATDFAKRHSCITVIHTENRGVSCARNTGIQAAHGKYVSFLDADDCLCKDVYNETLHQTLCKGEHDVIGFSWIIADSSLKYGRFAIAENQVYTKDNIQSYNRRAVGFHFCSYLYKREILNDENFPPHCRYSEDFAFLFLVTRKARSILSLDNFWFMYRNNLSSAIHSTNRFDYLISDDIASWAWAKNCCNTHEDCLDCEGNIFSNAVQYIVYACKHGVSANTITSNLKSCVSLQECMADYDLFWKTAESARIYTAFQKNPNYTCFMLRLKGIPEITMQKLTSLPVFRGLYFIARYKNNIGIYR